MTRKKKNRPPQLPVNTARIVTSRRPRKKRAEDSQRNGNKTRRSRETGGNPDERNHITLPAHLLRAGGDAVRMQTNQRIHLADVYGGDPDADSGGGADVLPNNDAGPARTLANDDASPKLSMQATGVVEPALAARPPPSARPRFAFALGVDVALLPLPPLPPHLHRRCRRLHNPYPPPPPLPCAPHALPPHPRLRPFPSRPLAPPCPPHPSTSSPNRPIPAPRPPSPISVLGTAARMRARIIEDEMRIQEASENWVSGDGGERKGPRGGERLERRGKRGENAMRKEGGERERSAGNTTGGDEGRTRRRGGGGPRRKREQRTEGGKERVGTWGGKAPNGVEWKAGSGVGGQGTVGWDRRKAGKNWDGMRMGRERGGHAERKRRQEKSAKRIPALEQRECDVKARELGERQRRAQAAELDVRDLRDEVLRDVGGGEGERLRGHIRKRGKKGQRKGGRGDMVGGTPPDVGRSRIGGARHAVLGLEASAGADYTGPTVRRAERIRGAILSSTPNPGISFRPTHHDDRFSACSLRGRRATAASSRGALARSMHAAVTNGRGGGWMLQTAFRSHRPNGRRGAAEDVLCAARPPLRWHGWGCGGMEVEAAGRECCEW
ncbi:hypothetical protein C8J57DRAFT_1632146 [Mycena rebaudengoi]|nr:hypothetical protein C8J57DRAFT_1632146 [Mycena rebaudengoi]